MAPLNLPAFAAQGALVLHDREYVLWLLHHLRAARSTVLAVQFIADIRPEVDPHRDVRAVASALAQCAWRGLDVRLILSRFAGDRPPMEPNRVFGQWLAPRAVGIRLYRPRDGSARCDVHSKFVVIDDVWVVMGSHNWSSGAFGANHEQSVAVCSRDVAARLRATFEGMWASGELVSPAASPAGEGRSA